MRISDWSSDVCSSDLNGTQAIFYDRSDVFFASIHAHPKQEYPFFLGYADETGAGAGEGCNANYLLVWGSGFDAWSAALADASKRIATYAPEVLVANGIAACRERV